MTKISLSVRLNEEQEMVLKEFKQIILESNRGAFYGHFSDAITSAMELFIEMRKKNKSFGNKKKITLETENKEILSYIGDEQMLAINEGDGVLIDKIVPIIKKKYVGVSAPTMRDKINSIFILNNWEIIIDKREREWVLAKKNIGGKDLRRGEYDAEIQATAAQEFQDEMDNVRKKYGWYRDGRN